METRKIQTPLLEITYEELGAEFENVVILLHGWPDDVRTWDHVAPALHQAGFRVIVPYLRGFGPTRFLKNETRRSGQLSALGQDVIDLIAVLRLDRVALVGHDWGARAAGIAASELQESGRITHVCLMSVGYGTNDPNQRLPLSQVQNYWYRWYMALPRGADLVHNQRREFTRYIWEIWAPQWKFSDQEFDATAASFDNPDWAEITLTSYRHRWGYAERDPQYDALERRLSSTPRISVPTLVLHGAHDPVISPASSEGKEDLFTGRYTRKLIADSGHFPQREQGHAVARELLAFLQS
jgi:pimeloyl-ACP methyl ester carboxylesterase